MDDLDGYWSARPVDVTRASSERTMRAARRRAERRYSEAAGEPEGDPPSADPLSMLLCRLRAKTAQLLSRYGEGAVIAASRPGGELAAIGEQIAECGAGRSRSWRSRRGRRRLAGWRSGCGGPALRRLWWPASAAVTGCRRCSAGWSCTGITTPRRARSRSGRSSAQAGPSRGGRGEQHPRAVAAAARPGGRSGLRSDRIARGLGSDARTRTWLTAAGCRRGWPASPPHNPWVPVTRCGPDTPAPGGPCLPDAGIERRHPPAPRLRHRPGRLRWPPRRHGALQPGGCLRCVAAARLARAPFDLGGAERHPRCRRRGRSARRARPFTSMR